MQTMQDNGTSYLLCHSTSDVTGWTTYAAIPYEDIGKTILSDLLRKLVIILSILIACCVIFVFLVSRLLSKPIRILSHAMGETGKGNFDTQIEYQPRDEFGEIFSRFNKMNLKIKGLIDSNYKTMLRKQEAELSALHFQLNPHFLYNTLNIINLMILKGENDLSSNIIIRLSKMLTYTTDTSHQKVPLPQDLEWLSNYFYITNIRFGSRISMQMNIQTELNNSMVPKLFLQPFIENAVIHGFRNKTEGCLIKVSGFLFDRKCIFEVEDNGCGIPAEKLRELNDTSCRSVGISNIRHRIALLYSEEYTVQIHSEPGQGTHVIITLPYETAT